MKIKGRIENWTVCCAGCEAQSHLPPELLRSYIHGDVYECEKYKDGDSISTSYIVRKGPEPNTVETFSGSIYKLGEPKASYVQWCKEQGHHVPTPEEPIKWRERAKLSGDFQI